ncbi:MAG: bifunctional diaminohydroxyphosphoribosylaminopyrimidine deaminase/5-amino-6-(5-phosphoribosylamino)uracil reductase RibD [Pirellulaceae bacterium]
MAAGLLDADWMDVALRLAQQGHGYVEPNPMVGCVLVADGEAIGEGAHLQFGDHHAERAAIANAHQRGNAGRLAGATAYVTLEPCCHYGKTPPCSDALLESRISRVVIAMLDPFEKVRGQGAEILRQAGVAVDVGIQENSARRLNAPYLKRLTTGRPWVIAKWAMSLDGKIATRTGHSQWISSRASRQKVQVLRGMVDAIVVGAGTALADNPQLVARTPEPPPRRALRVVTDSCLRIDLSSHLVAGARAYPTLLWAGPDADPVRATELRNAGCLVEISQATEPGKRLDELLVYLAQQHSATNVLVEGGGQLLGSLLDLKQIDQCEVFVAPKLIGGIAAAAPIAGLGFGSVDDGPQCMDITFDTLDTDLHISCRLKYAL